MYQALKNLRLKVHRFILGQKLKNLNINRASKNFEQAERIGIIFDATKAENQVLVNEYRETLIKKKKRVDMLAYFDDKQIHQNAIFKYFNKKSLSLFWIPKSRDVETFIQTPFDILINLHLHPAPHLEYVSALSRAHMRVGLFQDDKQYCYDLMIDNPDSQDLRAFTRQVDYLLSIINKNEQ